MTQFPRPGLQAGEAAAGPRAWLRGSRGRRREGGRGLRRCPAASLRGSGVCVGRGWGWVAANLADSAGPVQEKRAVKGKGGRGALWEVESLLRLPGAAGRGAGDYNSQQALRRRRTLPPPASCSPVPRGRRGAPGKAGVPLRLGPGRGPLAAGQGGSKGRSRRLFWRRVGRALSPQHSFWLWFRSRRDRVP